MVPNDPRPMLRSTEILVNVLEDDCTYRLKDFVLLWICCSSHREG